MKLSKVLAVALLGTIGFTSQAVAAGTTAGTEITNQPSLSYEMGSMEKTAEVAVATYVVDKVINFTMVKLENEEKNLEVGGTQLASFKLNNLGNSVENFVLSGTYTATRNFDFAESRIYVDSNDNDVLDEAEKVDTPLVEALAMDGSKKVWLSVDAKADTEIALATWYGILAEASAGDASKIYTEQSESNDVSAVDIVFADSTEGNFGDEARDNKIITRYKWTIIENLGLAKLDVVKSFDAVLSDPANGTNDPKAIPGALLGLKYGITNNTSVDAKDVVFTLNYDVATARLAMGEEINPFWNPDGSHNYANLAAFVHLSGQLGDQGTAEDDGAGTITYTIPLIKAGETFTPHLATVIL